MTQISQIADWPADRLAEARAVIADVVHHSDHLIRLACNVLAAHGDTAAERRDAQALLAVIEARRPIRTTGRRREDRTMNRRSTSEADAQRAIVRALRFALPCDAIVHHCANEVTEAGPRGARLQAILVGMGVLAGFADLIVISGGRVLFLEVKSPSGRLRKSQEVFRDTVVTQGFGWALVRTVDEALRALADNGFTSRVQLPARRAAR